VAEGVLKSEPESISFLQVIDLTSEQLAWLIRRHGVEMAHISHGSHIGSTLSVADIIAVLYADVLRFDASRPDWDQRDRFILSKGHASAALYAALAESGFFPVEELKTHYENGGRLSGHASHFVPGVEVSTGSLGHGLSMGVGMAYAAKKSGDDGHRVFVVISDGECDEGSVWEAALFANHFRLNNLVTVVDYNHMQSLDFTGNTLEFGDFSAKWRAFGWHVIEADGNDHMQLKAAFAKAEENKTKEPHRPSVIIASTVKGFGVSFMQNDILWHYRFPHDGWEYDTAVSELFRAKPAGAEDPYTPEGIADPLRPGDGDDIGRDHTFTASWRPGYPEKMRRMEAKSGSSEKTHQVKA